MQFLVCGHRFTKSLPAQTNTLARPIAPNKPLGLVVEINGFTATSTRWNQQCSGKTPRLINGCGKGFVLGCVWNNNSIPCAKSDLPRKYCRNLRYGPQKT